MLRHMSVMCMTTDHEMSTFYSVIKSKAESNTAIELNHPNPNPNPTKLIGLGIGSFVLICVLNREKWCKTLTFAIVV